MNLPVELITAPVVAHPQVRYGMVDTMRRTYRTYEAAIQAGIRRSKRTGNAAYVGMLLDCRFHIADESPERDWRFDTYTMCTPSGTTAVKRNP